MDAPMEILQGPQLSITEPYTVSQSISLTKNPSYDLQQSYRSGKV